MMTSQVVASRQRQSRTNTRDKLPEKSKCAFFKFIIMDTNNNYCCGTVVQQSQDGFEEDQGVRDVVRN